MNVATSRGASLVKSRQRVADHGEVFTPAWLVEAMLELVAGEVERIDSRVLEPACGSGNFLEPILRRKLATVDGRYGHSDFERRHQALLALMSIYGIEILADNAAECRANLRAVFAEHLSLADDDELLSAADAVLATNIVHGDALSMKTIHPPAPILFAEWAYLGKGDYQRWVGATEYIETADQGGSPVRLGVNGRCKFCGASQEALDRGDDLEAHAYALIYADDAKAFVASISGADVQFDVIIGNPPCQLNAAGGTRDIPIYQHFVEQAKALEPRLLSMVIPARWMAGGLGLSDFRRDMLADTRIRDLVDHPNAAEVFSGVGINGGVCYFLWDPTYDGECSVTMVRSGERIGPFSRPLGEFDVLVRDARALSILRKVLAFGERSVNTILARDKEFGWTSNFAGFHTDKLPGDVPLYYISAMKRRIGYIARSEVKKSADLIDTWKLLVPQVGSGRERERSGVDLVLGPALIAPTPSVCTQSFLFFHAESEAAVESIWSYYRTRFFRFLVSLRKISQHATHSTYSWVPMQTWDRSWTDHALYQKYGIADEEAAYIESIIRPMETESDGKGD